MGNVELRGIVAAAALALAALAAPAMAADAPQDGAAPATASNNLPSGGMTSAEVVAWLQAAGYSAQVAKEGYQPEITASASGKDFRLVLYDCQKDGRCAAVQFAHDVAAPLSAERANAWNVKKRYAKLQLNGQGQASLRYDANLSPGGTYDALYDDLYVWLMMLTELTRFVSEDPSA